MAVETRSAMAFSCPAWKFIAIRSSISPKLPPQALAEYVIMLMAMGTGAIISRTLPRGQKRG